MTETFFNGGAGSGYIGGVFQTGTDILNQIKTTATTAGMTVELDDVVANQKLILKATYPSTTYSSYLVFEEIDNPATTNSKWLRMRGSDDAIESNVSSNYDADFTEGADNNLWVSAEEFALNLGLRSSLGSIKLWHSGYPILIDPDADPYADGSWYVGWLTVYLDDVQVAKAAHNGVVWRTIGDDYNFNNIAFDNNSNANNTSIPTGTFDKRCVAHKPYGRYGDITSSNAGFNAHLGSVNALNNKPIIDGKQSFWYTEGRGATNQYSSPGNGLPAPLYYRGSIWGAATGMASLTEGDQAVDPVSGERYLTAAFGWQGFRIA